MSQRTDDAYFFCTGTTAFLSYCMFFHMLNNCSFFNSAFFQCIWNQNSEKIEVFPLRGLCWEMGELWKIMYNGGTLYTHNFFSLTSAHTQGRPIHKTKWNDCIREQFGGLSCLTTCLYNLRLLPALQLCDTWQWQCDTWQLDLYLLSQSAVKPSGSV